MKKYSINFIFSLLTVFMFVACEEDTEFQNQQADDELSLEALKDDLSREPLLRSFVENNQLFTQKYDTWLNGLPTEEKKRYLKGVHNAIANDQPIKLDMSFIEASNLEKFHKKQQAIVAAVVNKYPQFSSLDIEDKESVKKEVFQRITNTSAQKTSLTEQCHSGYNSCSWHCYDNGGGDTCYDACWAGYVGCSN